MTQLGPINEPTQLFLYFWAFNAGKHYDLRQSDHANQLPLPRMKALMVTSLTHVSAIASTQTFTFSFRPLQSVELNTKMWLTTSYTFFRLNCTTSSDSATWTRDVLSPGNRAKARKFRYAKPVANFHTEDIATERENSHFRRPHSYLIPPRSPANPNDYRHKTHIAINHRPWATFFSV